MRPSTLLTIKLAMHRCLHAVSPTEQCAADQLLLEPRQLYEEQYLQFGTDGASQFVTPRGTSMQECARMPLIFSCQSCHFYVTL